MLTQLKPLRAALSAAIAELGCPVFAQRSIKEDELDIDRFVSLTLSNSNPAGEGVDEAWDISMVLGVYLSNPATDDDLEQFAQDVFKKISANADVAALVSGVLFAGHNYPEEQGEVFSALEVQYVITLDD